MHKSTGRAIKKNLQSPQTKVNKGLSGNLSVKGKVTVKKAVKRGR